MDKFRINEDSCAVYCRQHLAIIKKEAREKKALAAAQAAAAAAKPEERPPGRPGKMKRGGAVPAQKESRAKAAAEAPARGHGKRGNP